jgi:hypothetical protein
MRHGGSCSEWSFRNMHTMNRILDQSPVEQLIKVTHIYLMCPFVEVEVFAECIVFNMHQAFQSWIPQQLPQLNYLPLRLERGHILPSHHIYYLRIGFLLQELQNVGLNVVGFARQW